jgi:hypothetical protein
MGFGTSLRLEFLGGQVQRRGTRVNTPKNGSRAGETCFGGIQRFYAELRRELIRGNLDLDFFGVLVGDPRGGIEEGGQLVFPRGFWGNFMCQWVGFCEFF